MTINIVGGVYREYCTRPAWDHVYGSGGRAAIALGNMETPVTMHAYADANVRDEMAVATAWLSSVQLQTTLVEKSVGFSYLHDLATPEISDLPQKLHPPLHVKADKVVRFGMLEGNAVVDADWGVYDPQNVGSAEPFGANGSKARRLGLVLNGWEARQLSGLPDQPPAVQAGAIAQSSNAEVVVIKMGPRGALVWASGKVDVVPAYRTSNVWKIGSGDCFAAHFANGWMHEGRTAVDAADRASRATAYYCQTQALPTADLLASFQPSPVQVSTAYAQGAVREVYLAGPFFDLAQVWMIEEARRRLRETGLKVFSPFHDIGLGSAGDVVQKDLEAIERADLLFAVADGLDPGTIYEIGYARALNKPVVVYSEREAEESLKMMEGSNCQLCKNFTTAVYTALWEAAKL